MNQIKSLKSPYETFAKFFEQPTRPGLRELLREFVETAQALTDSTFPEAMDELNGFLAPLIAGARHDSPPPGSWIPGKGWVESLDLAADGEWGVPKSGR